MHVHPKSAQHLKDDCCGQRRKVRRRETSCAKNVAPTHIKIRAHKANIQYDAINATDSLVTLKLTDEKVEKEHSFRRRGETTME